MTTASFGNLITWQSTEPPILWTEQQLFQRHDENCIWRPGEELEGSLPERFWVLLRCLRLGDGARCFIPAPSFSLWVASARIAGLAILTRAQKLPADQRNKLRYDFLLYETSRHIQQRLNRKFESRRDLLISPSGRSSLNDVDILPWLRTNEKNAIYRLPTTVDELLAIGVDRSNKAGFTRPKQKHGIQFGLIAAAELMPTLKLTENEVAALIRSSLFSVGAGKDLPDESQIAIVYERLGIAISRHLDDWTIDRFTTWLWGAKNTIVKQLAKQRRSVGSELPRDLVREALVELGWRAHFSIAETIEALMVDFRNAINPPLDENELQMFNLMYLRQQYFGGLSLAMLVDRFNFLDCQLYQMINQPADPGHIAILYRLLAFYAEMSEKRRKADQRIKEQHSKKRTVPLCVDTILQKNHISNVSIEQLDTIAQALAKQCGIECNCQKPDWKMTVRETDGNHCSAILSCQNHRCDHSKLVDFDVREFRTYLHSG